MTVKKRDGKIIDFDNKKIEKAVLAAARSAKVEVPQESLDKIVKYVVSKVSKFEEPIEINDIQNAVEDALMRYNFYEIERVFHDYRKERDKIRRQSLEITREMEEKLAASNVQNSNANVDEASFGGRKGEMINSYLKDEALTYRINEKFSKMHENNEIYEHDLDSWSLGMSNCQSVPFDPLMKNGIKTRQVFIRPAGSIATFLQLIAVGFQLQSLQQFGGVAATHIDSSAVPYIRLSLMKHYFIAWLKSTEEFASLNLIKMMFDDYQDDLDIWHNRLEDYIDDRRNQYLEETKLVKDDFFIGSEKLDKILYQSALYDTIKEVKQGVEALLHNLNSLQSRSGNQLPFSSINYGLETSEEGRILVNAILHNTIRGVGKGMTSVFPCQIFQLKDGINTEAGNPNYDLFQLALRSSAKRMYPNYVNCDWSNEKKYFDASQAIKSIVLNRVKETDSLLFEKICNLNDEIKTTLGFSISENKDIIMNVDPQPFEAASTMGCRTYSSFDINFTEDYFLDLLQTTIELGELPDNYLYSGAQKDGRGNVCPSTIIMPTFAMKAKKKAEKEGHPEYAPEYFMSLLEKAIGDCKDELIERFNWICAQRPSSATFMWENNTMKGYDPKRGIRSSFIHDTLAIGQIGLAETLQILVGCNHLQPKGMELAHRIEKLFRDKCAEYKDHYRLNFGVYYTPAEGLSYTAYKKFLKKYKLIENVTAYKDENGNLVERGFFTNSIHVPVWEKISPFEKIDVESQLTGYSSAGCITYVEIGDNATHNLEALEQIVLYAKAKDVPYFAVNVPLSECTECGNTDTIDYGCSCPKCGAPDEFINHYARVTGYLSTSYKHFNPGKQRETRDRFKHIEKLENWKK